MLITNYLAMGGDPEFAKFAFVPPPGSKSFGPGQPIPPGWVVAAVGPGGGKYYKAGPQAKKVAPAKQPATAPKPSKFPTFQATIPGLLGQVQVVQWKTKSGTPINSLKLTNQQYKSLSSLRTGAVINYKDANGKPMQGRAAGFISGSGGGTKPSNMIDMLPMSYPWVKNQDWMQ